MSKVLSGPRGRTIVLQGLARSFISLRRTLGGVEHSLLGTQVSDPPAQLSPGTPVSEQAL